MSEIPGIKAISFDGDGTLWDFEKVMCRSLSRVLTELERIHPEVASKLDIEKMIGTRNKVAGELKGKVTNLEEIRLQAFIKTLQEVGRPDESLALHLNQLYLKHRFEGIELFDDVLPTLRSLKKEYILGLVSNGNSYPERCGLEGMFRFVVFSQDHGVEKPDPMLFEIALEEAGCKREEMLHVGDSLRNDVLGAMGAGIKCVWLNRKREKNTLHIEMDHEISTLGELLDIL